jgi:hypothetical protein
MERVAAFLLAALITGCACADVGCNNVLRVHPNVDLDPDIRYGVRVCVDDRCGDAALNVGDTEGSLSMSADGEVMEFMLGGAGVPDTASVTFTSTMKPGISSPSSTRA